MESGDGNAKRGCGRWMEDCGRGAAVEQLTVHWQTKTGHRNESFRLVKS